MNFLDDVRRVVVNFLNYLRGMGMNFLDNVRRVVMNLLNNMRSLVNLLNNLHVRNVMNFLNDRLHFNGLRRYSALVHRVGILALVAKLDVTGA